MSSWRKRFIVISEWIKQFLIDNSLERSQEEHTNAALSGDDGGYYNTAEITTYIRTQDLHRVISEKNKKENNVFLDEYKVVFDR